MKQFKVKKFASEAKKDKLTDKLLLAAIDDFLKLGEAGQQRLCLGAGLYKLRIATKEGRGKSAGSRSILAYRENDKIFWLHIFSKNDKENITSDELKRLKMVSNILLKLSDNELNKLIKLGELREVK